MRERKKKYVCVLRLTGATPLTKQLCPWTAFFIFVSDLFFNLFYLFIRKTSQTSTGITCSPLHSNKTSYSWFPQLHPGPVPLSAFAHASPFAGTLQVVSAYPNSKYTSKPHQTPLRFAHLLTEQLSQLCRESSRARASG